MGRSYRKLRFKITTIVFKTPRGGRSWEKWRVSKEIKRRRRNDALLGQQQIQWTGLRLWISTHRRMIRWRVVRPGFGEMKSTPEDSARIVSSWVGGDESAIREGGVGVCSVFRVAGTFAIWEFELQAASDVMHQIWKNMQQCLYHYDLNARDTIIEYMQLELSHSSTATRDARARKVSNAVK